MSRTRGRQPALAKTAPNQDGGYYQGGTEEERLGRVDSGPGYEEREDAVGQRQDSGDQKYQEDQRSAHGDSMAAGWAGHVLSSPEEALWRSSTQPVFVPESGLLIRQSSRHGGEG